MKYEKNQKGNPHELTICQHIFPAKSIARFTNKSGVVDESGVVEVKLIAESKIIKIKPKAKLFCARRIWDQRAESGYMKKIEDNYQSIAGSIVNGILNKIGQKEKPVINDMFAIWNIRAFQKNLPIQEQKINGITGVAKNLTIDEQELLEKNHVGFIQPDLTFPGRQLAGIHIQQNLDMWREQLKDAEWGILRASNGEFIVPDNFSNIRILPITPKLCLYSPSNNQVLGIEQVAIINKLALDTANKYYFAHDLSKCPRLGGGNCETNLA